MENDNSKTQRRVEVLCLTYGEPESNDWRPQYDYSLSILNRLTRRVAPIPRFVTPILAARRGLIRSRMFNRLGFNSPLEPISEAQADKIGRLLRRKRPDTDFNVRVVCEFRAPYLNEYLDKLMADPPDELILLPLYMAESDFTTGISRTDLAAFHKRHGGNHGLPAPTYVAGFGFDERFGKVMADFVGEYCERHGWTEEKCRGAALILGAHGTLQYPPEGVNSGAKETLHLFGMIRKHLKDRFRTVRVGWLNHTLGGKWTFPAVDETGEEVQQQGIKRVVYFPFGFMGDNNESINEGKDALANFEWEEMLYLPCPNDDDRFCDLLAEMTLERLDNPEREDWNRIEEGGRRDLIQPPRPAVESAAGFLRLRGPGLAITAAFFWLTAGGLLLYRGGVLASGLESATAVAIVLCVAVLLGWYKGAAVLIPVMKKNLRRLSCLPQPSPVYRMFSKWGWIIIAFFMSIGIVIRLAGLSSPVYAAILLAVGLALVIGGGAGLLNVREAAPRRTIRMKNRAGHGEKPAPQPAGTI